MKQPHLTKRQILGAGLASLIPASAFADDVVRIPFDYYRDWVPVVPVSVNDSEAVPFIFSTGASLNRMDDDLAKALALKQINRLHDLFLGNQTISPGQVGRARDVEAEVVKVGGVYDMGRRVFSVRPSTAKEQGYQDKHLNDTNFPRGTLGMDLFVAAPCILDYEARELRMSPAGLTGLDGFMTLPARITRSGSDISVSVRALLDDQLLNCAVDTAGRADLYLASKYVREHNLYDRFPKGVDSPLSLADSAKGTIRTVRMKNFDIGGIHFDEINVTLGDPLNNDHLSELDITAVVGRGLLKQLSLAFPGDGRVMAKANSAFKSVSDPWVPILSDD